MTRTELFIDLLHVAYFQCRTRLASKQNERIDHTYCSTRAGEWKIGLALNQKSMSESEASEHQPGGVTLGLAFGGHGYGYLHPSWVWIGLPD